MATKSYHFRIDLVGALKNFRHSDWIDCVTDDDGSRLIPEQVKQKFRDLVDEGVLFVPMGVCSDFDPVSGCRGHEVSEKEEQSK